MAIGKDLLKLARESIQEEITGKKTTIPESLKQKYSAKKGVFVTLTQAGDLRGCIGLIEPVVPLWQAVHQMAKQAAFNDPRFNPITSKEVNDIKIEISTLTQPVLIIAKKLEEYLTQINIGVDGLIIEKNKNRGLLLPQVFPEWKANARKALEMTCEKAGLEQDAWKQIDQTKVYKFQCEIIRE